MSRRRNPRFKLAPVAINVAVVAGGAWLLYWLGKSLLNKFGNALDKPADAIARTIVGKPMELAPGITFILPDGRKVPASAVTLIAGGKFTYGLSTYKPVAASPPGSGFYTVQRVA
jgi:hypothetical protein